MIPTSDFFLDIRLSAFIVVIVLKVVLILNIKVVDIGINDRSTES